MKANPRMISMLSAFVLLVAPAFASPMPKAKAKAEKVVQGTVFVATDVDLVIRKGKSDVTLMYDSATQKPATLTPGTLVTVHYRDEKNIRVATVVEVTGGKADPVQGTAK